jgi:hypothetical protein
MNVSKKVMFDHDGQKFEFELDGEEVSIMQKGRLHIDFVTLPLNELKKVLSLLELEICSTKSKRI